MNERPHPRRPPLSCPRKLPTLQACPLPISPLLFNKSIARFTQCYTEARACTSSCLRGTVPASVPPGADAGLKRIFFLTLILFFSLALRAPAGLLSAPLAGLLLGRIGSWAMLFAAAVGMYVAGAAAFKFAAWAGAAGAGASGPGAAAAGSASPEGL